MAFPRLNAFSFWISAFRDCCFTSASLAATGLYGGGTRGCGLLLMRRSQPSVLLGAGHSTDYWILGVFLSGIGSVGTA